MSAKGIFSVTLSTLLIRMSQPLLQRLEVVVEVLAAERTAALEIIADRVFRQRPLGFQRGGGEILGLAAGLVAEPQRIGIVPPGAFVVGHAIDHLVDEVGFLEADADQLYQVVGLQPDRQPALVDRLVAEIADANTERAEERKGVG